jgi:hypothetical protein
VIADHGLNSTSLTKSRAASSIPAGEAQNSPYHVKRDAQVYVGCGDLLGGASAVKLIEDVSFAGMSDLLLHR